MKNSKLKTQNSKLAALVVAYVLLAALYSVVTPLGEGPDEPGHAAYVFFLAREGRLPVQQADRGASDVPGEGHQPPLAYALAAPLVAWLPAEQRRIDQPANPRFVWSGGSEPNAVAHGSREFWPWSGAVLAWHLARLASAACGAATVVFAYLAARELTDCGRKTGDRRRVRFDDADFVLRRSFSVPILAAALVAFNPQFLFVSALVTNDAPLTALSAAMLWLAVRHPEQQKGGAAEGDSVREQGDTWRAVVFGLVLGLALLTKQSAIILIPIALAGAVWPIRKEFPAIRHSVRSAFTVLAVALLVSGWWYLRNLRLYGDLFGLAAFQAEFTTQAFEPGRLDAWVGALKQLHSSFWARFGWMNIRPPGWTIWFFTAVEVVALAGLARRWMANWRRRTDDGTPSDRVSSFVKGKGTTLLPVYRLLSTDGAWALLILPILAFAWIVSFALTAGLVAWQGRLLFPALPAIAILLAVGLSGWRRTTDDGCAGVQLNAPTMNDARRTTNGRGVWAGRIGLWSFVVGLLAIALWLPFGAIRPAYTIHTLPEQVALERLGTPTFARLARPGDPGAELRGWRLAGDPRPGATIDVGVTWHALGRQDRNWTVFVHLVDAHEQIVAEDNREPRDGAFPTQQWVTGDWIEDTYPLALPATLAPGTYELRVGMWYPRTGRRTAVYNEKNKLIGDSFLLRRVTIPVSK